MGNPIIERCPKCDSVFIQWLSRDLKKAWCLEKKCGHTWIMDIKDCDKVYNDFLRTSWGIFDNQGNLKGDRRHG